MGRTLRTQRRGAYNFQFDAVPGLLEIGPQGIKYAHGSPMVEQPLDLKELAGKTVRGKAAAQHELVVRFCRGTQQLYERRSWKWILQESWISPERMAGVSHLLQWHFILLLSLGSRFRCGIRKSAFFVDHERILNYRATRCYSLCRMFEISTESESTFFVDHERIFNYSVVPRCYSCVV